MRRSAEKAVRQPPQQGLRQRLRFRLRRLWMRCDLQRPDGSGPRADSGRSRCRRRRRTDAAGSDCGPQRKCHAQATRHSSECTLRPLKKRCVTRSGITPRSTRPKTRHAKAARQFNCRAAFFGESAGRRGEPQRHIPFNLRRSGCLQLAGRRAPDIPYSPAPIEPRSVATDLTLSRRPSSPTLNGNGFGFLLTPADPIPAT